jgi:hypothetical protein
MPCPRRRPNQRFSRDQAAESAEPESVAIEIRDYSKGGLQMAGTIHFSLRNNQMTDVNVNVWDDRNSRQVLSAVPLNRGDSVAVEVVADSSGQGAAHWTFASSDGSVNSGKQQPGINDGDECTLG